MTDITLSGSIPQMRQQSAVTAVLSLIEQSCFFSPEKNRHGHCRQAAIEHLGLHFAATDSEINKAMLSSPAFLSQFYCQGAATGCAACGSLNGPGVRKCIECGENIDLPVGLLAKAEWQTRLTTEALRVAITTHIVAGDLLSYTIHRTTRLLVLRNMLNHSDDTDWNLMARDVRNTIVDAWPEGLQPDKASWEWKFIRISAVFWIVVWPMLKGKFTLDQIDTWNTKEIRAAVVSATKWFDAGADPEVYGTVVDSIMKDETINRTAALAGVSPADAENDDDDGDAVSITPPPIFIHPLDLVSRGTVVATRKGFFLGVPISQDECDALAGAWGNKTTDIDEFLSAFKELAVDEQ
jgi:hypothetical protein